MLELELFASRACALITTQWAFQHQLASPLPETSVCTRLPPLLLKESSQRENIRSTYQPFHL